MFMAISGYLFFAKTTTLTPRVYLDKLRSRGRSLLVPYIFWNAIVIGCFWAMHRFTPSLINPNFENVANYPPHSYLDVSTTGPEASQSHSNSGLYATLCSSLSHRR